MILELGPTNHHSHSVAFAAGAAAESNSSDTDDIVSSISRTDLFCGIGQLISIVLECQWARDPQPRWKEVTYKMWHLTRVKVC